MRSHHLVLQVRWRDEREARRNWYGMSRGGGEDLSDGSSRDVKVKCGYVGAEMLYLPTGGFLGDHVIWQYR